MVVADALQILLRRQEEPTLVIDAYLDQQRQPAEPLGLPVLTGMTPQQKGD